MGPTPVKHGLPAFKPVVIAALLLVTATISVSGIWYAAVLADRYARVQDEFELAAATSRDLSILLRASAATNDERNSTLNDAVARLERMLQASREAGVAADAAGRGLRGHDLGAHLLTFTAAGTPAAERRDWPA